MKPNPTDLKIVETSPLIFKINRVSQQIFSEWKDQMEIKYSDYSFDTDERTLLEDVKYSFAAALKSLFEEEKNEKRDVFGWSEGFIYGFVSSNLSTHWLNECIYSETKEYKQLMFLKSIILYLEVDVLTTQNLEKLYNYLTNKKIELSEENDIDEAKIICFEKFKKKKEKRQIDNKFLFFIVQYLQNIMLEKHHFIFNKLTEQNYIPKLDTFFNYDEIRALIDFYESKKRS